MVDARDLNPAAYHRAKAEVIRAAAVADHADGGKTLNKMRERYPDLAQRADAAHAALPIEPKEESK